MAIRRTSSWLRIATMAGTACTALTLAAWGSAASGTEAQKNLVPIPPKAGVVNPDTLKGVTLGFVSYGGIYQKAQEKGAAIGFSQRTGAHILSDSPTNNAKIKAQVESHNVSWDVVDVTSMFAANKCGKLFMPLDSKLVDRSQIPQSFPQDKCSVPAMGYALILVYNKKKYGSHPPASWADFYNTKDFPGKRGIQGRSGTVDPGVLESALLADGVAPNKLYPLDVPRALRKLDSIREDLVFWTSGAQSTQQLDSGQVDMSMIWSGRALQAIQTGAPYAPVWNHWIPLSDVLAVPIGTKHADAAMAFINYYLGADQQAKMAEISSYTPVNINSKPKLEPLAASFLTNTPTRAKDALPINQEWWGQHFNKILAQWTMWLAQ